MPRTESAPAGTGRPSRKKSSAARQWAARVTCRTATGKRQKFKLRAPYWEGREKQVN